MGVLDWIVRKLSAEISPGPMDKFKQVPSHLCNALNNPNSGIWANSPLAGATTSVMIAILVSFLLLLLMYMFNLYRRDQRKMMFVKLEIYELFVKLPVIVSPVTLTNLPSDSASV